MAAEKTILVTGVTGFIGAHAALQLLEKGYAVRGTSRSAKSVQPLVDGIYKPFGSRFQVYEVADITVDGAFDEAAKGVDGILHIASPVTFTAEKPSHIIDPAVHGTQTLLNSGLKAGPQLKTVVVTSSVVSIVNVAPNPDGSPRKGRFTEADWNEFVLQRYAELGESTPGSLAYGVSKVLAEKAVWKFRDELKPSFAIAVVNPGVVMGPPAQLPATPEKLNETSLPVWNIFAGKVITIPPKIGTGSFVDVRDVAKLHLWALEHPEVSNGERYIAVNGSVPPQAIADILRQLYPARRDIIPEGHPGADYRPDYSFNPDGITVDNSKATKAAGIKWISAEDSIKETAKLFESYL